jgi:dienelactone hydrolase
MSEVTKILLTDHYAADFYASRKADNKILAITFTPFSYTGERTLAKSGFATSFLLRNGFDVIAIKSARNTLYQDLTPDMLDTIRLFANSLPTKYTRRVSYGMSMGGYAAIQFSKVLDIDAAFAISPGNPPVKPVG